MKTMTCQSLGGPCEQKLSAGSWDEMGRRNEAEVGGDTGNRTLTEIGFMARRCKSSTQPDGGEGLAKRKGEITLVARRGLKEAWSKDASR
jgi:hypothetical protein